MNEMYINSKLILITKEQAYQEYLNNARRHVNLKVTEACRNNCTDVSIQIKRIPKEVMEEIKESFQTIETDEYVSIVWSKEQSVSNNG